MTEDKVYLINKIFNNETIRTVWNKEEEKYYLLEMYEAEEYIAKRIKYLVKKNDIFVNIFPLNFQSPIS